jgi:hypothetical protein
MSHCCSELDSKLLNERIIRSVADVVKKEIDEYLSEKLVEYNLYKDTYEQIMNIPVNKNIPTCCCEELKKEVESLRCELNTYRETSENVTLEINEKDKCCSNSVSNDVNPEDDDDEEEIDEEEFKCEDCNSIQGKNQCELCDTEDVCEDCNGQGGDYGPNEIWVCNNCLPTCNDCGKKLYSAVDDCCGKGRSDIEQEEEEENVYHYLIYKCSKCGFETANDDPDCSKCKKKSCMLAITVDNKENEEEEEEDEDGEKLFYTSGPKCSSSLSSCPVIPSEEEEDEDEEEVYEIEIKGKRYYTNDPDKKNGDVYSVTSDDEVGDTVGKFKDGKFVLLKTTRTM